MSTKYRAQILLEPEQHDALVEAAQRENRSISDLVREIVDKWLRDQGSDDIWRQRMQASNELRSIRERIEAEHGIYQGDIIEEIRTERDEDFERIWRGEE
jgi:hypothetical protein